MAITTYAELQASIADWLNRADLTAQIPDFIALSEARFNRTIRTRDMLTRRQATVTSEYVGLPFDFLETYQLQLPALATNTPAPLKYISPEEAAIVTANAIAGNTRYYTIIDGSFWLIPAPGDSGATLTITYYAKIPALADDNQTNWLLSKAPDLYLYAALANAAPYLNNDDRVGTWGQLAISAYDELMMDSERASRSRTQLTARAKPF